MTQEILFDRNLLQQNRKRVAGVFEKHNFLHHEIANRIAENVSFLNRNFVNILEIGARDYFLSGLLLKGSKQNEINENGHFAQFSNGDILYDFFDDAEILPQFQQSYDLILSNLNLHFINQIPQFLLQVKDLLRPDGVFIASFFGEENLSELAHILHATENEIYGGISPRMPPTIDVKTAAHLLQKAGFKNPTSEFAKIEVDYSDPMNLLKDLKNMGQSNVLLKRSRQFMTRNFLKKLTKNYFKNYSNSEGGVRATFEIITITGWK